MSYITQGIIFAISRLQSSRIRLPGSVQPPQDGDLDCDQGLRDRDPELYPGEQPPASQGDPGETSQV